LIMPSAVTAALTFRVLRPTLSCTGTSYSRPHDRKASDSAEKRIHDAFGSRRARYAAAPDRPRRGRRQSGANVFGIPWPTSPVARAFQVAEVREPGAIHSGPRRQQLPWRET